MKSCRLFPIICSGVELSNSGDSGIRQQKTLFQIEGIDNSRCVVDDALDLPLRCGDRILRAACAR